MSNKLAFTLTGIFAVLSFFSWVTVETPFAESNHLSNGLLYSLCAAFGLTATFILIRQFTRNHKSY